jgi:hypothetical protein
MVADVCFGGFLHSFLQLFCSLETEEFVCDRELNQDPAALPTLCLLFSHMVPIVDDRHPRSLICWPCFPDVWHPTNICEPAAYVNAQPKAVSMQLLQ